MSGTTGKKAARNDQQDKQQFQGTIILVNAHLLEKMLYWYPIDSMFASS